jgi:hypothetical protein
VCRTSGGGQLLGSGQEGRAARVASLAIAPRIVFYDDPGMPTSSDRRALVVVEGADDIRRLGRLLVGLDSSVSFLDAHGSSGVRITCRSLGSGFDGAFLGICDRDAMTTDEAEDLCRRVPGLFVWPSRCLENELLHPPLLTRALDMSGHDISELDVRRELRAIADEQYDYVHASIVEHRLRRGSFEAPPRAEAETPIGGVRRRLEATGNSAQGRILEISRVSIHAEAELRDTWEEEHLLLMDGKRAMSDVAHRLAPNLHGVRGLEQALLRHAADSPPPGIAALQSEVRSLLG